LSGRSLRPLVESFLNAIRQKQPAQREGRKLYDALFGDIPDLSAKSHLIVVPDGPLHLVPFDALVNTKGRPLVQTHTIAVASSSSTDMYLRRAGKQATTGGRRLLLGVGGLPYNRSNTKLALTRGYTEGELGNLPSSRDEVLAAAAALHVSPNTLLLGSAGTEHAFKTAIVSRPQIVHLAVHGVANREHPDQAGLLLLSDPAQSEDGVLYPHEIVQLPLNAELVVLSACDTAAGKLQGQEGVANLSRAFLLAGAKTVVSTLWSIDDTFSLYLMKRFYEHLSAGRPRGDALVQAKRDMIRKFGAGAMPYYWAGFVMEGNGRRAVVPQ
jgi:CHAT domain-containing protein